MHRIGRDFAGVVVERGRQRLEGEAGGRALHALVDTGRVLVFLQALGPGIDLPQILAVIDAHLGIEVGVLMLAQPHSTEKRASMSSVPGAQGAFASSDPRTSLS